MDKYSTENIILLLKIKRIAVGKSLGKLTYADTFLLKGPFADTLNEYFFIWGILGLVRGETPEGAY